ncbi:hypothetical protein EJ03DRAFT_325903 [Teratosphaeria nubilosa]|uniref:Uncharacterized protein n=1 Tax=Teratosphaeria nubilosa TaxID=161662 RepID=A0A6G1LE16_9PEZI|nr:hypothetical protein EJ03DRAFT_325903 [Teratosphaeria nubilosa]
MKFQAATLTLLVQLLGAAKGEATWNCKYEQGIGICQKGDDARTKQACRLNFPCPAVGNGCRPNTFQIPISKEWVANCGDYVPNT